MTEIMSRLVIVVEPSARLTAGDVLDLLVATMRGAKPASRVEVTVPEDRGGLARLIWTIEEGGAPITHLASRGSAA